MILVDTCVLIDIVEDDPRWFDWSAQQLAAWLARGPVLIDPMVFAEWSALYPSADAVESAMSALQLQWRDPPRQALFVAAKAHVVYRRSGGSRPMVLPDFLIGAHAAVERLPLLTRDRGRFEAYFPTLQIVAP